MTSFGEVHKGHLSTHEPCREVQKVLPLGVYVDLPGQLSYSGKKYTKSSPCGRGDAPTRYREYNVKKYTMPSS